MIQPDDFHLLISKEFVSIPPDVAAEMIAYDPTNGELRTHYAGFCDPGFGYGAGLRGTQAVFEVRAHDVPFMLEDGQPIARLAFERMAEPPRSSTAAASSDRTSSARACAQPPVQGARGEHPLPDPPDDQRPLTRPSNPPPDTAALPARILVGRRSEPAAALVAQQSGPPEGEHIPRSALSNGRNGGSEGTGRNGRGHATAPVQERAFLVGLGLPAPAADAASGVAARAGAARAHRGRDRRRAGAATARASRPRDLDRRGQARGDPGRARDHGLLARDLRRAAFARAAAAPRIGARSQGAGPQRADPRHLSRAARAPARRRCRWSLRSTSTCCRGCVGSGSTSNAPRAQLAHADRARPSSRPTAG